VARISRFSPWQTPRDQLERLFVAREPILDDLVERALLAATTESRLNTLLVGPRGAGKTHLLAMLYYRLQDATRENTHLQVARLPEDPLTITSYPRLLAAIAKALTPDRSLELDADSIELALDQTAATNGPIVVLLENLDEIFTQIGVDGQHKLRHYLQTSNSLLLIATTSVLDRQMSVQDTPFYQFFSVIRLQPLSVAEAQQMLLKLADAHRDNLLAEYLQGDQVAKRLEIVSHLAGSHPRIWSIFSDVMTTGSLQHISELLYASFDDLTPYYRDRLMSLTPQQRLVVNELATVEHPLHVDEIAKRAQLDPRSTARTVRELKDAGWIEPVNTEWLHLLDGRRTYYELSEPLTRLAFQAKEAIGQPVDLIVNFLSVWFDPEELAQWSGDDDYLERVRTAWDDDNALLLTRWLSRLPASKASDEHLLGQADDALQQVQDGDAQALMALPSQVRIALEKRCQDPSLDDAMVSVRRDLHSAAMEYMGWVPHEPQSAQWIARAESLAAVSGQPRDYALWAQWLARGWRFDQTEAVANLIDNAVWRLDTQNTLSVAYRSAGLYDDAMTLDEQTLVDCKRILGSDHHDTITSRNNLALDYRLAGRLDEAITLRRHALTDLECTLGPRHPDTLSFRNNLTVEYWSAGRLGEAIALGDRTLADCEHILGLCHPTTLSSRNNLAIAYRSAGQPHAAIVLDEQTLSDCERILGPDHPYTLSSRNNLAYDYWSAGRLDEAIALDEQTLTCRERVLGPDHPDTIQSRHNLEAAHEAKLAAN